MISDVSIIDYGSGNILSVRRAFEEIGYKVNEVRNSREISESRRLVLPGVGAFPNAMAKLQNNDLVDSIKAAARDGVPLLGICLGMQLLLDESTEFRLTKGLGLVPGKVDSIKRFTENPSLLIPRIGWFNLFSNSGNYTHPIFESISDSSSFYHVHSFMGYEIESENLLATSRVTSTLVAPSIIAKNNIYGFQFHPEKSGKSGLRILNNFVKIT